MRMRPAELAGNDLHDVYPLVSLQSRTNCEETLFGVLKETIAATVTGPAAKMGLSYATGGASSWWGDSLLTFSSKLLARPASAVSTAFQAVTGKGKAMVAASQAAVMYGTAVGFHFISENWVKPAMARTSLNTTYQEYLDALFQVGGTLVVDKAFDLSVNALRRHCMFKPVVAPQGYVPLAADQVVMSKAEQQELARLRAERDAAKGGKKDVAVDVHAEGGDAAADHKSPRPGSAH